MYGRKVSVPIDKKQDRRAKKTELDNANFITYYKLPNGGDTKLKP